LTKDLNKGITLVTYNHPAQPLEVQMSNIRKTIYTYSATGSNLTTELWVNGSLSKTTEYSGAFVYEDGQLSYINIPEGRYVIATGKYEYNLTDHLGNVRVTFTKDLNGSAKIIQVEAKRRSRNCFGRNTRSTRLLRLRFPTIGSAIRNFHQLNSGVTAATLTLKFNPVAIPNGLEVTGGASYIGVISETTTIELPLSSNEFIIHVSTKLDPDSVYDQWHIDVTIKRTQNNIGYIYLLINGE
jgi:hypothetical protein